jgi:23S rRNA (uracil1939-C5)-methyltransferase
MIARIDGQVALVSGAIPGETVTAEIERVGKGVLYARTVDVKAASPDRRAPFTDPLCGGSLYAHISYARQLEIKTQVVADAFVRIARVPLPAAPSIIASREDGYRMRARLHLRGRRVGFFREGTHEICSARSTRQLLPETCDAVERIIAAINGPATPSAVEIEVSENVDATMRVVHLEGDVAAQTAQSELTPVEGVSGITARAGGYPAGPGTARVRTIVGEPYVTDDLEVGGQRLRLRRHVLAFFQGNRYLLPELVAHVVGQIEREGVAVDLYAGVGLFAVAAAITRGVRVSAVEGDRVAADDLAANAVQTGGRVVAVRQSVESVRPRGAAPGSVIVDPPRTGMSRAALDAVLHLRSRTIVYVSCDIATLARDARRMIDAGYELRGLTAFDLFPNTPHVETVAVLGWPPA